MVAGVRVAARAAVLLVMLPAGVAQGDASGPTVVPVRPVEIAQQQPWRVVNLTEDANLEGRGIFHLDFETDGTVWIAASDGLYRYDGYHWDRFGSAHGLPSDYVRSVRVTRDGTLWVGTDRGAGTFDGTSFDSKASLDHLPGPSVRRITEDPAGTLWFACDQWPPSQVPAGLARYRNGEWDTWDSSDGLPSDYVSDLFTSTKGERFVLTRAGLAQFDGELLRRPIEEAGIDECRDYIWSMVESTDGDLIATTRDWVCVRRDGVWQRFRNGPPSSGIGEITLTRDGAILTTTSEPTARFAEWQNDRFVADWATEIDSRGSIQYIAEAADGSIWVTGINLLIRWERSGGEWHMFEDVPHPMLRDPEGGIWFADHNKVLRLLDDQWSRITNASAPLVRDRSGSIWMQTPRGLTRWRNGGLSSFDWQAIGVKRVQSLNVDGAGTLWIIGPGANGLPAIARFDDERWASFALLDLEPADRIVGATPDVRSGMLYVVENTETDLYRALRVDETIVSDVAIPEVAQRYWVPRLTMDRRGNLWLFGMLGLQRQTPERGNQDWELVDLPGKQLQNVVTRGEEVWFSFVGSTGGRGGVSRFADETWSHFADNPQRLISSDGGEILFFGDHRGINIVSGEPLASPRRLTLPERMTVASLVGGLRGDFWLGAGGQAIHYRPDGIDPETIIDGTGRSVIEGGNLVLPVRGVERFAPRSRSDHFNISLRIDDEPWSDFEPLLDRTITMEEFPVGDHVIHVRVQDQGLDVDPTPAVLRFRVYPIPLQDRRWFQILALGVFLTVMFLSVLSIVARQREIGQRRRRRVLERELLQISEREQSRIGRDLHDGLGQRLTGISYQCEALRGMLVRGEDGSPQRADEIGISVREAISETRTLAHALYPPEIDQGNFDIALRRLVETADRAFDGTCRFRHEWSPDSLSPEVSLNIYRLVQEALNNAVRHSLAETIEVESRQDGRTWVVEVRDDGRGFDSRRPPSWGLGLQIMRYRANMLGGWLSVESRHGSGTVVRCSLRATGT